MNSVWVDFEESQRTDGNYGYALLRDFKNPPVLGETVCCNDMLDNALSVLGDVVIISEAGVVKIRFNHNTWTDN